MSYPGPTLRTSFDEEGSMAEECEGGELPLEELARRITSGAVRMAAATAAWLVLVAEFDRRGGWGVVGIRSCAHWLAWQCGLSPGAAREHVRVARALGVLPATAAAFAAGRLSYAKVRALTRVADPDTEPALLELTHELTASQLERVVREWRRSDAVDGATVAARRRFDSWWDDDGMLQVRLSLPPEEGAAFLAGVDSLAERTARRERAAAKRARNEPTGAGQDEDDQVAAARDRTAARRCAAVAQLATAAADADRRAGDPPRREVVVHAAATAAVPARAVRRPASSGCTPTTCGTGCTAGRPTWPTWCCSATPTTASPTIWIWSWPGGTVGSWSPHPTAAGCGVRPTPSSATAWPGSPAGWPTDRSLGSSRWTPSSDVARPTPPPPDRRHRSRRHPPRRSPGRSS